ncbi:DNA methyltransferase [Sphingobium sp. CAP-1]|uniref:DNA methyltransferase n=1 Tax=Sphingobium sp. CAP-1 TaxID=2676077 RepID=UPI0012BB44FC|nr:DNA methyltransferase [Sphingobium sp. CAP-1]QGP78031.1 site-specific DNA-methyltransferase [Sphingobium sp. CAP-1]
MARPVAERAPVHYDDLFPETPPAPQLPVREKSEDFLDQIRNFREFGSATIETVESDIPYFVNEYWTAGQRQGHSIHEISYRACFKPQLPAFFIDRLTQPGDVVHDPFMGRGTTPIQAALMGRAPSATDINPLSALLTRPRLAPPDPADVDRFLGSMDWDRPVDVEDDLLVFYHPQTLRHLTLLRDHLLRSAPLHDNHPDPVADWVRMVAINRLTGHSPGFFSVYTLPPNQAVSITAQRKINEKRGQTPPVRDIRKLIVKKSRTLLKDGRPAPRSATLLTGPADRSSAIPPGSVQLVVTSPPFLDIVQYADDNWLRCWFAGIDMSCVPIAMHRTEEAWTAMIRKVLEEQARILIGGGHIAFEVGEVRKGKVLLERLVWKAAEGLPFDRLGVVVNQQEFTKTANCWGVNNNSGGTNTNRIVVLRKHYG